MSKEKVLTMDRSTWESMRHIPEKVQIKEKYEYLLDLINNNIVED
jgi:hypothetical protein